MISKNENFKYFHPNKKAQELITVKYEFTLIDIINNNPIISLGYIIDEKNNIPTIDFLNLNIKKKNIKDKIYFFFEKMLINYNGMRPFYVILNTKKILFHAYFITHKTVYDKFFYLLNNDEPDNELMYFMWQDCSTGIVKALFEIKDIVSVNYYNKFNGINWNNYINDDDLLYLSSIICYCFKCKKVLIHGNYDSYIENYNNLTDENIYKDAEKIKLYNPEINKMNIFYADITNYCIDFYNIIWNIENKNQKFKPRYYNYDGLENKFKFNILHNLRETKIEDLQIEKQNILFRLYKKNNFDNMLTFYIFIHKFYFCVINQLQNEICKFLNYDINIFNNIIYIFNPYIYLFNNKHINDIPHIESYNKDIYDKIRKEFDKLTKSTVYRKKYIIAD